MIKEFRKEVEKTMYDELTKNDIKKMEEEIEYRKTCGPERGDRGGKRGESPGRLK